MIRQRQPEIIVAVSEACTVVGIANKAEAGIALVEQRIDGALQTAFVLQHNVKRCGNIVGVGCTVEENARLSAVDEVADVVAV